MFLALVPPLIKGMTGSLRGTSSAQGFKQAVVALRFQVNGAHRYREVDEEAVALFFLYHCRKLFHQQFLHTLRQSLHARRGVYADDDRTEAARRRETQSPGCFSCIFLSRSTDLVVPSGIIQRRLRTWRTVFLSRVGKSRRHDSSPKPSLTEPLMSGVRLSRSSR